MKNDSNSRLFTFSLSIRWRGSDKRSSLQSWHASLFCLNRYTLLAIKFNRGIRHRILGDNLHWHIRLLKKGNRFLSSHSRQSSSVDPQLNSIPPNDWSFALPLLVVGIPFSKELDLGNRIKTRERSRSHFFLFVSFLVKNLFHIADQHSCEKIEASHFLL